MAIRVAICERKCASCNGIFGTPEIGDFTYGQFVLAGEHGTVHAILNSIENPTWDWITAFAERPENIPEIVARIADSIDGQRLSIHQVCPNCLACNWEWWDGKRVGWERIPSATFVDFENLDAQHRSEAVRQIELKLSMAR